MSPPCRRASCLIEEAQPRPPSPQPRAHTPGPAAPSAPPGGTHTQRGARRPPSVPHWYPPPPTPTTSAALECTHRSASSRDGAATGTPVNAPTAYAALHVPTTRRSRPRGTSDRVVEPLVVLASQPGRRHPPAVESVSSIVSSIVSHLWIDCGVSMSNLSSLLAAGHTKWVSAATRY
jgi:hypothetical protein